MNLPQVRWEQALGAAARLDEILREEYQTLVNRDMTALDIVVRKKQQQLAVIEEFEADLKTCGQASGDGPASRWRAELQELLTRCQKQNRINGGVLEISRRHIQRILSLLQGQPPESQIYGPNGSTGPAIRSSLHTTS